jgi:hypothetical protein
MQSLLGHQSIKLAVPVKPRTYIGRVQTGYLNVNLPNLTRILDRLRSTTAYLITASTTTVECSQTRVLSTRLFKQLAYEALEPTG